VWPIVRFDIVSSSISFAVSKASSPGDSSSSAIPPDGLEFLHRLLIAHAEQHLGAHHSPDLFHVQHETVKATSLMLANQTRHAHQAAAKARQLAAQRQQELAACRSQCAESSHVAELQQQTDQAAAEVRHAQERLTACQNRQQQACEVRRGISRDYHPVDMETGDALSADDVQRDG
jgi:hypothetical protein